MIRIRPLERGEYPWADAVYREVHFLPLASHHQAFVADIGGEAAGIGRLVDLEDDNAQELSGIVTLPAFRGLGVADRMVSHLVGTSRRPVLYCIPLPRLEGFYQRFGLEACARSSDLPCAVRTKLNMCDVTHAARVSLLRRLRDDALSLRERTAEDDALLRRWQSGPAGQGSRSMQAGRSPAAEKAEAWIARWNGRDIGWLDIHDPEGGTPGNRRLICLRIAEPDCVGRGLGTRLMRLALARSFSSTEVGEVTAQLPEGMTARSSFFSKLGFEAPEVDGQVRASLTHRLGRSRWESLRPC